VDVDVDVDVDVAAVVVRRTQPATTTTTTAGGRDHENRCNREGSDTSSRRIGTRHGAQISRDAVLARTVVIP
jgi:hypothetical protein